MRSSDSVQNGLSLCCWVLASLFLWWPPFGPTRHVVGIRHATDRLTGLIRRICFVTHEHSTAFRRSIPEEPVKCLTSGVRGHAGYSVLRRQWWER